MTAKIAVVVVAFGLIAAGLLSTRQSRLQAAHEVTAARLRIREHDERLLELRSQIAARVTPGSVRALLAWSAEVGPMVPLAERVHPLEPAPERAPEPSGEERADAS
jgi:hypothetical protein